MKRPSFAAGALTCALGGALVACMAPAALPGTSSLATTTEAEALSIGGVDISGAYNNAYNDAKRKYDKAYDEAYEKVFGSSHKSSKKKSSKKKSSEHASSITLSEKTVTPASLKKAMKKAKATKSSLVKVTLDKSVGKISKRAFASCTKVKTLVVKTTKLSKNSVRNSLDRSNIKTIKIQVGSKSQNKRYIKKYTKAFASDNSGAEVTVR